MRACFIFIAAIVGILAAPVALAANLFDAGAGLALSPEIRNGLLGRAILVGWIALAMLLPDFDGREDSDWGDSEESYRRPY